MRLVTDTIEFSARQTPRFNPISISGYHIREAGSTAVQELAFTLRDGIEYVEWALERGLAVDEFAPRLSFFFNAHSDFFEEIAKYRAARKIWAHVMRDRFGAQTSAAGSCASTPRPPAVRSPGSSRTTTSCAPRFRRWPRCWAATQSLHTNSLDEAYALPSEHAVTIALRTQQVIALRERRHRRGRSAGRQLLRGAPDAGHGRRRERLHPPHRRDGRHDRGHRTRLSADAKSPTPATRISTIETGEQIIVGVNAFQANDQPIETPADRRDRAQHQVSKLAALRARRDNGRVRKSLDALRRAAEGTENTMPFILDAVRAYATLGEICDALAGVFGTYQETTHI